MSLAVADMRGIKIYVMFGKPRESLPIETVVAITAEAKTMLERAKSAGAPRWCIKEIGGIVRDLRRAVALAEATYPQSLSHRAAWDRVGRATHRLASFSHHAGLSPALEVDLERLRQSAAASRGKPTSSARSA